MPCAVSQSEIDFENALDETDQLVELINYVIDKGKIFSKKQAFDRYAVHDESTANNIRKKYTRILCSLIKCLNQETLEYVVYDARCKTSRQLADWWENHQEEDRKQAEAEQAKIKQD